jgi:hypothetical protein
MTIAAIIRDWSRRLAGAGELAALGPEGRGELAREFGMTEGRLVSLAVEGQQSATQLPRMMRALALDPDQIRRQAPAIFRDMEAVCSQCRGSRRCRRNLDRGQAGRNFGGLCPNEPTIAALRQQHIPA